MDRTNSESRLIQDSFDLASASYKHTVWGNGIEYVEASSTPGGLIDIDIGGEIKSLAPGDKITGVNFSSARISRNASSVQVGTAALWIFRGTADHRNESKAAGNRAPVQVYNEAASALTHSAPTLVTEGVDVSRGSFFWAFVSAAQGATVTGGSLDIYRWDTPLGDWVFIMNVALNGLGTRYAGIPMDWSGVQDGRLFAAPNAVTLSAGATCGLHMWSR